MEIEEIKVRYIPHTEGEVESLKNIDKGDWIDLRSAETITLSKGEFKLIPLGVAMQLPDSYEAILAPRSSTYKNFGIIQANSIGVIDESYCGNTDEWMIPVIAVRNTTINFNDRICQFRIIKHQPHIKFTQVTVLHNEDRGGFGSTGK